MSEKKIDPLLADKETSGMENPALAKEEEKPIEKPAEVKPEPEKPVVKTTISQVKAEAIAKFPKDIVLQTKYILDHSEHVNFIVPKVEGEAGEESVQINGYKLTIQKNVMVNIPIQVASMLADKYRINMEAGADKKIDRDTKISDALS